MLRSVTLLALVALVLAGQCDHGQKPLFCQSKAPWQRVQNCAAKLHWALCLFESEFICTESEFADVESHLGFVKRLAGCEGSAEDCAGPEVVTSDVHIGTFLFFSGFVLFIAANYLTRIAGIYYLAGGFSGMFLALILFVIILHKITPAKKWLFASLMFTGMVAYKFVAELGSIVGEYWFYFALALAIGFFFGMGYAYYLGEPQPRTKNLGRWLLKFVGGFLMYTSTQALDPSPLGPIPFRPISLGLLALAMLFDLLLWLDPGLAIRAVFFVGAATALLGVIGAPDPDLLRSIPLIPAVVGAAALLLTVLVLALRASRDRHVQYCASITPDEYMLEGHAYTQFQLSQLARHVHDNPQATTKLSSAQSREKIMEFAGIACSPRRKGAETRSMGHSVKRAGWKAYSEEDVDSFLAKL